METIKSIIQDLAISDEIKDVIFAELKHIQKRIDVAEFKYNRTVLDKDSITNVLNATIADIEKQKGIIEKARNEIELKNIELNIAMELIKEAQSQLVQSEKMASLGELTAGIAHEIQNPLNFVNNFSELSVDLAKELREELEKLALSEKDKEYISEIIGDLSQNQEKIFFHGKRASDIVKGMLEHSRESVGDQVPTDINALCNEYLRLSYHGLRAKDKSFNADFEVIADVNLPKVNVVPQDMGRVLLNLINNAFWTVNERARNEREDAKKEEGINSDIKSPYLDILYKPKVTITTQLIANSSVLISIKDNGSGISQQNIDKIFQPFFTTKPTGQGTGLGLSITFGIIEKHKGKIEVNSEVGKGTEFLIYLPINS